MSEKEFTVRYTKQADRSLEKMDQRQRKIILTWINEKLEGCDNPRKWGKALEGERSPSWRYRVGKYRILADILDEEVIIFIFKIGARDKMYRR